MNYREILKNFLFYGFIILLIFFMYKLTCFYVPFIIAYVISVIIEPIIIWLNKKTSLSRKVCSIIVLISLFLIIISLIVWGSVSLISETTNLLSGINTYLEKSIIMIKSLGSKFEGLNSSFSKEVVELFQKTTTGYLNTVIDYLKGLLNKILEIITAIPNMLINIIITSLATYFISSDKFYILDRLEHHLSRKMMNKIKKNVNAITSSLGGYIKAEIILSVITFLIVLTGLNIFYIIGMDIKYPILMASLIGFVDLLPILGAGTIMIPWGLITFLNNNISLSFSILGLYILTTITKQFIEPKLVSKQINIHPIFTIISMYTGLKFIGIIGLLIGPIVLIVLKNIFSDVLDKGILKTIMDD